VKRSPATRLDPRHLADGYALASWTRAIRQSVLRDILPLASEPGTLSFALGMPAPELFPREALGAAAAAVLADPEALQYAVPAERLKEHVVALMAARGVQCRASEVFLTTGAQQGMDLLARLFVEDRGTVLVEEATYDGLLMAVKPMRPRVLTVPTDARSGLDVDAVESLLCRGDRPAFLYVMSDGHNPLGVSLAADKRARLVDVAARHGLAVVEDDAYGLLHYEGGAARPLRALGPDVLYLGSFSKILAPALRVGWIVAPEPLLPRLSAIKQASDLDTATFSHRVAAAYLDAAALPAHLERLRVEYRARRDALLQAIAAHFPEEARVTRPRSGFFAWVELPERIDTRLLLPLAVRGHRVAYVPGHAFAARDSRRLASCLRLSFSSVARQEIDVGISRLGAVLKEALRP
jgi:2-aminoadipate transaminase